MSSFLVIFFDLFFLFLKESRSDHRLSFLFLYKFKTYVIILPLYERRGIVMADNNLFTQEQVNKFAESIKSPEFQNYQMQQIQKSMKIDPYIPEIANPMVTQQKITNQKIAELKNTIESIRFQNMKLNAQIEVLNKTIESDKSEIEELQKANTNLKVVNKTLEENNKHYWRNTILINMFIAIFGFVLGIIFK